MEFYQWLLRKNGYQISDMGYFLYCNGKTDRVAFDGKLDFDIVLIPYKGNDSWVDKTIRDIRSCLMNEQIPLVDKNCEYCAYRDAVSAVLR